MSVAAAQQSPEIEGTAALAAWPAGSRTVHLFVRRHETRNNFSLAPRTGIMSATSAARAEVFPMDNRRTSPEKTPLGDRTLDAASTFELLELAKSGSGPAVNVLFTRYLPPLRRWARGRLPRFARDMLDTDDLVQDTVFQTLRRLQAFEPQHEGALQAYLRQAVVNRIRDEVRRAGRHPASEDLEDDAFVDEAASPLDEAIGREAVDRYETALQRLKPEERQAIILRVELQLPYAQVAEEMKKPSSDAARMAVARALVRLAEEMGHEG